jgi:hypothetical protein
MQRMSRYTQKQMRCIKQSLGTCKPHIQHGHRFIYKLISIHFEQETAGIVRAVDVRIQVKYIQNFVGCADSKIIR